MKTKYSIYWILFIITIKIHAQQSSLVISYGMDPKVQGFLDEIKNYDGPPIEELSIAIGRQAYTDLQLVAIGKEAVTIQEKTINIDNKTISIKIVRPENTKENLPALMYFHGGGWILGNAQTHDRLIRELAVKANVVVIFVNYSLSPEVRYPVAIEEGYSATKWVAKYGKTLGIDSSKIAVGGDSVGGNMATVVALMAKERKEYQVGFQLLFYPVTDSELNSSSYKEFARGYYLTKAAMKWFWDAYVPDNTMRDQILVSPLRATTQQLNGLPPALIITAEYDVLRDEGEAYAQKLRAAGVSVKVTRYEGTIHDFVVLNTITQTTASRGAISQAVKALQNVFYKTTD
jgi:acetyl esterase